MLQLQLHLNTYQVLKGSLTLINRQGWGTIIRGIKIKNKNQVSR